MTSTLSLLVTLASLSFGHGHHARKADCCDACGVERAAVLTEVHRLLTCPRWRDRDDAAHELRDFSWKCHPEIATALVHALMTDREEEVREEAAESLAKLAPCLPEVHLALKRAADCDPDHATRKWARRGLKALGRRCAGACSVCEPSATVRVVVPATFPIDDPLLPAADPRPPLESEPLPPPAGSSPFVAPPATDLPPLEGPLSQRRRPIAGVFQLGRRIGAGR